MAREGGGVSSVCGFDEKSAGRRRTMKIPNSNGPQIGNGLNFFKKGSDAQF